MIKLSILIRRIPGREKLLAELLAVLTPQMTDEVEIITDDTFPQTMGAKGNVLVSKAKGEYVSFIDDDDLVPGDYVKSFIQVIDKEHTDVISIEGICCPVMIPGTISYRYVQALHNPVWAFENPRLLRTDATQIAAVRREVSLQCPFPDIQYYDDRAFAEQLKKVAKSEYHLTNIMYIHRFNPVKEYKY